MYIKINDIKGEKRIELSYTIQRKEVAVIMMFSSNIQYWIREPEKLLLVMMKEEKQLPKETFMASELSALVGRSYNHPTGWQR